MAKNEQEVRVCIKDGDVPATLEVMEQSIIKVSALGKQLDASRLSRRAILLLIQDETGLPMSEIGRVLDALPKLAEKYLKKA